MNTYIVNCIFIQNILPRITDKTSLHKSPIAQVFLMTTYYMLLFCSLKLNGK